MIARIEAKIRGLQCTERNKALIWVAMLDPEQLRHLILDHFPDAEVEVEDLTGTKDHYRLKVISSRFDGLPPLRRHRLVYEALGERVGQEIHALSLSTQCPNEAH